MRQEQSVARFRRKRVLGAPRIARSGQPGLGKAGLHEQPFALARAFEKGGIPGASFRNQEFTGDRVHYTRKVDYTLKMLAHDAQTSGGLMMCVPQDLAGNLLGELEKAGEPGTVIGEVLEESPRRIYFE